MTTPLAKLQAAREESTAALLIQQRKTADTAAELSAILTKDLAHYAAARRLRSTLRLATELSGEDRDAELFRATRLLDELMESMAATTDRIGPAIRRYQTWAAGLDHCLLDLERSVDAAPELAKPIRGRPELVAMRNENPADAPGEPVTAREWLSVFRNTFLRPKCHSDPLMRQYMANHCRSDVRTLERICQRHWFAQKERRLGLWELRQRAAKSLFRILARRLQSLLQGSNPSPQASSSKQAVKVSSHSSSRPTLESDPLSGQNNRRPS